MIGTTHKLLAIDLDGTLLNSQKEITPRTEAALIEAQKRGHRIVLATGRPIVGARPYARQLRLDVYHGFLLCFNGATILQCEDNKLLYENYLPAQFIPKLYTKSKENGFAIMSYEGDCILTESVDDKYIQHAARINRMQILKTRDFANIKTPVPKCIITGETDRLILFEKLLRAEFGDELSIIRSESFFLEVMNRGVEKGTSLAQLLQMIHVNPENLVSFGDSYNDESMLRLAGWSVAMGNARTEIQSLADEVTASNDENGVSQVVVRRVLF